MHDPMTTIYTIRWPRKHATPFPHRKPLLTIWHRDPAQLGYGDDSCGWFRPRLTDKELVWCKGLIEHPEDNLQHFFADARDTHEMRGRLAIIIRNYKGFKRPWWKHPRWHFWHWRLQVHPLQNLKRWLFTRCAGCGQRLGWHSPAFAGWSQGERGTYHRQCLPSRPVSEEAA